MRIILFMFSLSIFCVCSFAQFDYSNDLPAPKAERWPKAKDFPDYPHVGD